MYEMKVAIMSLTELAELIAIIIPERIKCKECYNKIKD